MATPPVFVSGAILTAAQMNAAGMWLIKTQTIGSAVASVAVTNVFSADYENYKIVVTGGVGSAGQAIALKLGTSTASYYQTLVYATYAGVQTILTVNNGAVWTYAGESNTSTNIVDVDVLGPFIAKFTGFAGFYIGSVAGTVVGYHQSATSHTGFTLTVAGTMTGGTIAVYGYRGA
jgi:hypothetical protein